MQDTVCHRCIHADRQVVFPFVEDSDAAAAGAACPVILICIVLLLQAPCGKLTVIPPRFIFSKDLFDRCSFGACLHTLLQQHPIHDPAPQHDLAGGLQFHFSSGFDKCKIRRGRPDVHHQYRLGQDIIRDLKMLRPAG